MIYELSLNHIHLVRFPDPLLLRNLTKGCPDSQKWMNFRRGVISDRKKIIADFGV